MTKRELQWMMIVSFSGIEYQCSFRVISFPMKWNQIVHLTFLIWSSIFLFIYFNETTLPPCFTAVVTNMVIRVTKRYFWRFERVIWLNIFHSNGFWWVFMRTLLFWVTLWMLMPSFSLWVMFLTIRLLFAFDRFMRSMMISMSFE